MTEAKIHKKRELEPFRDFGQAIEDLYRRAYLDNRITYKNGVLRRFWTTVARTRISA